MPGTERNGTGKARSWMMTWNNPLDTTWDKLLERAHGVKFMVGQYEMSDSGTPHWQVYMHFPAPRAFSALKKQFPLAHLEVAHNNTASIAYVRKERTRIDGPFTFGIQPIGGSGKDQKSNWDDWYELARTGRFEEIPAEIQIKHLGNLERIHRKYGPRVDQPGARGIWIWGKSGIGKSHWARKILAEDSYYAKPANKWWDGYNGQNYVILEDVDHDTFKFLPHQLKIWADQWHFVAETKGGAVFPANRWFVITSNYPLSALLNGFDSELREAILRRFHQWQLIDRDYFKDTDGDLHKIEDVTRDFKSDHYDPC